MIDQNAFIQAYDRYADAIYRHCLFRTGDADRAQDLMQDTFIRAWKYVAEGREIDHLRALLYKIANNLIIDNAKRSKKTVSLEDLHEKGFDPGMDETQRLHHRLDAESALAFLPQLKKSYQEMLVLRYVDEFSPKEIAQILGKSENLVSVTLHRALSQLRKILPHE